MTFAGSSVQLLSNSSLYRQTTTTPKEQEARIQKEWDSLLQIVLLSPHWLQALITLLQQVNPDFEDWWTHFLSKVCVSEDNTLWRNNRLDYLASSLLKLKKESSLQKLFCYLVAGKGDGETRLQSTTDLILSLSTDQHFCSFRTWKWLQTNTRRVLNLNFRKCPSSSSGFSYSVDFF